MPRTLPWLINNDEEKNENEKSTSPQNPRARSSSPADLVDDDLNIISGAITPQPKAKKRVDRSPSTSPPPAAPDVEFMREGLNADDLYMMVEDEFDATARLFTQHIHHAEYVRLKRLHRSRGAETLAKLGHGTDGVTQQSRAMKMQIEAGEKARKRESTDPAEDESEDEYLDDPQLASLMTASQRMNPDRALAGLRKAKSTTRAAAGYKQSPRKGARTKDVFARTHSDMSTAVKAIAEDDETDEDDLNGGPSTKTALFAAYRNVDPALDKPRPSTERTEAPKPDSAGFFKQFAKKPTEQQGTLQQSARVQSGEATTSPSTTITKDKLSIFKSRANKAPTLAEILAKRKGQTQQPEPRANDRIKTETRIKEEPSFKEETPFSFTSRSSATSSSKPFNSQSSRVNDVLARRKTEPVKVKEEAKSQAKSKLDDIPTFLF